MREVPPVPLRPPPDGWTDEDLDRLPPEAPRHVELIDGALVVRPRRRSCT
ncbi:hypothetical protein [Planomonospora alba]